MRRIWITLSLVALVAALLATPSGASASHLSRADFKSASKYCKALRAEMGTKAFKREFGRGKHNRRALRRCIRRAGAARAADAVTIRQLPTSVSCPAGTIPNEEPLPVRAFSAEPCVPDTTANPPVADDDDDQGDDNDDADEADDDDSGGGDQGDEPEDSDED